jgi:hypothetical protein
MLAAQAHGNDYMPGNFGHACQGPKPVSSCENGITQMTSDHWIVGRLWARCGREASWIYAEPNRLSRRLNSYRAALDSPQGRPDAPAKVPLSPRVEVTPSTCSGCLRASVGSPLGSQGAADKRGNGPLAVSSPDPMVGVTRICGLLCMCSTALRHATARPNGVASRRVARSTNSSMSA